jgi:hypothetical protein
MAWKPISKPFFGRRAVLCGAVLTRLRNRGGPHDDHSLATLRLLDEMSQL